MILEILNIEPSYFMINWFKTLFASHMALDNLFRLWDFLFLKGDVALFWLALGIFKKIDFRSKEPEEIHKQLMQLDPLVTDNIHKIIAYGEQTLPEDRFRKIVAS